MNAGPEELELPDEDEDVADEIDDEPDDGDGDDLTERMQAAFDGDDGPSFGDDSGGDGDDESSDRDGPTRGLGDVYCRSLGKFAATARIRYGETEETRDALTTQYEEEARDLYLDEYVNEMVAEMGGPEQMGPREGFALMSFAFVGMLWMEDPDAIEGVLVEVGL